MITVLVSFLKDPYSFVDEVKVVSMFQYKRFSRSSIILVIFYRVFHRFGHAKFPDGGLVLGSSQFSVLTQLSPKTMFGLKEVKIDSKIINSHCESKSVTHSVSFVGIKESYQDLFKSY